MNNFYRFLDEIQPPMSDEDRQTAIEWHEMRMRRALCAKSALRDWNWEHPVDIKILPAKVQTLPKVETRVEVVETKVSPRIIDI